MIYRIITRYPYYDGCMPVTGYVVQVYEEGILFGKWKDVKVFGRLSDAKQLLKMLRG